MAASSWLDEIQALAAARGLSAGDLARATGMKPGNLRRLLKSSPESPRLGTMMRLLEPLGCRVAPAGARTAADLVAFLDGLRQRKDISWAEVCEGSRVPAKIAERLSAAPEALSLGAILELARRLDVELTLAAEDAAPSPAHGPPRRTGSSKTRGPARNPPLADLGPSPASQPAAPSSPTSRSPRDELSPASPWSLRPPRLGRYGDAPSVPARERPPRVSYVPPEPSYTLEHAMLGKLADFSTDAWRSAYTELFHCVAGAAKAPVEMITDMARATEQWFSKFRRPRDAEPDDPPENLFEGADPTPLVQAWLRSKTPDGDVEVAHTQHDEFGRAHKIHLALDGKFGVVVRLGQGEAPHTLARVFFCPRPGTATVTSDPGVSLVLHVGDTQRSFAHADAGPVFAELAQAERVLLLAAVSWAIVLVQIDPTGARVLWGGQPEKFVDVRIDAPASPSISEQPGDPAVRRDASDRLPALQRALDEERSDHATTRSTLASATCELEACRAQKLEAERQAEAARSALEDARRAHEQQMAEAQTEYVALEQAARKGILTLTVVSLVTVRELNMIRQRLAAAEEKAQDSNTRLEVLARENAELIRRLNESTGLTETRLGKLDKQTRDVPAIEAALMAEIEALRRRATGLAAENTALREQIAEMRMLPGPEWSPPGQPPQALATQTPPQHAPEPLPCGRGRRCSGRCRRRAGRARRCDPDDSDGPKCPGDREATAAATAVGRCGCCADSSVPGNTGDHSPSSASFSFPSACFPNSLPYNTAIDHWWCREALRACRSPFFYARCPRRSPTGPGLVGEEVYHDEFVITG